MITPLRHLWRHHPVALTLFAAASVLVVVFALRVAVFSMYWSDPDHRRQAPEPWMTPGYVAHSWHLPIEAVFDALGLKTPPGKRMTIEQIADMRGVAPEVLIAQLETFLAESAPAR